jgi:hypothetical protein
MLGILRRRRWKYRDLEVSYERGLDGGGSWLAAPFCRFVADRYQHRAFRRVYEWCAGPGFIGFAMLAEGLCEELVLADINPRAVASANRTIRRNRLDGRVQVFLGDGVAALPPALKFDLVVGNPPNYFRLNPRHPQYKKMRADLRPNDPGWRIHRDFYSKIGAHLEPGALLLISEISPHESVVFLPGSTEPYDVRERPAIDDFRRMAVAGGLEVEGSRVYAAGPGITAEMMISRMPGDVRSPSDAATTNRTDRPIVDERGSGEGR